MSAFRFPVRVYYEDTDAAGIVYYANYLRYAERARSELLRELGMPPSEITRQWGVVFAVRRCNVEYLVPARLDDEVEVVSRLVEVGAASIRTDQRVQRDGQDLVCMDILLACIDGRGRPVRIPRDVRDALVSRARDRRMDG